jgi:hypothetical protein
MRVCACRAPVLVQRDKGVRLCTAQPVSVSMHIQAHTHTHVKKWPTRWRLARSFGPATRLLCGRPCRACQVRLPYTKQQQQQQQRQTHAHERMCVHVRVCVTLTVRGGVCATGLTVAAPPLTTDAGPPALARPTALRNPSTSAGMAAPAAAVSGTSIEPDSIRRRFDVLARASPVPKVPPHPHPHPAHTPRTRTHTTHPFSETVLDTERERESTHTVPLCAPCEVVR